MAFKTNQFVGNQERTLEDAIQGALLGLWTAMPCVVMSYNPSAVTITALPAIKSAIQQPDGSIVQIEMPILLDVPVVFTRGGGCAITHPINVGDDCLVIFADRCIDSWWYSGCKNEGGGLSPQSPMENRSHDLSDGFAIFAPQSQPNKIKNISTNSLQIRSDDGQTVIDLNPVTHQISVNAETVNVNATTANVVVTTLNITAQTIRSVGQWLHMGAMSVMGLLSANGGLAAQSGGSGAAAMINGNAQATGDITAGGKSLMSHEHSGVQTGSGTSGPPT